MPDVREATLAVRDAGLSGLIPDEEGAVLAALAALVPADQAIIELGSYKGKSTCYLAAGARAGHGAVVYAIDAWNLDGNPNGRHGYAEQSTADAFDAQLAAAGVKLGTEVVPVQEFTVLAGQQWAGVGGPPVGMLYVDADHSYEAVWSDFWTWWPHLADDAIVAFDDWQTPKNPGVERAVRRIEAGGHLTGLTIHVARLAVARLARP